MNISIVGVIVDCTNYFNGGQMVNVIDFSEKQQSIIYLLGYEKCESLINVCVGDIIYIQNFRANLCSDVIEFNNETNQARYYHIQMNNKQITKFYDKFTQQVIKTIQNLKQMSIRYFKQNQIQTTLKKIKNTKNSQFNPQNKYQQIQQKQMEQQYPNKQNMYIQNFSTILRVIRSEKKQHFYQIILTDQKQQFFMKQFTQIQPDIYLISNIQSLKLKNQKYQLKNNKRTNYLKVLPWMLSHFEKTRFQNIGSFAFKQLQTHPLVRTKFLNPAYQLIPEYSLRQVIKQLDYHDRDIRVRVQISEIKTNFLQAIRFYDYKSHSLNSLNKRQGQVLIQMQILLQDQSCQQDEIFHIALFTFDNQGIQFMPGLSHNEIKKMLQQKREKQLRERYDNIVNRLLQQTNFDNNPIQLILRPSFNGKRTMYRIVDTQLIL